MLQRIHADKWNKNKTLSQKIAGLIKKRVDNSNEK